MLLIIAALCSCREEEAASPSAAGPRSGIEDLAPLAVGNYWVYAVSFIDSSGAVSGSMGTDSVVVTGQGAVDGLACYFIATHRSGNPAAETGAWRLSGDTLIDDRGRVLLSLASEGETAWAELTDNGTMRVDWCLALEGVAVEVPAGVFSARRWLGRKASVAGDPVSPWSDQELNWAEGVGLVQAKEFQQLWPMARVRRLVAFGVQ